MNSTGEPKSIADGATQRHPRNWSRLGAERYPSISRCTIISGTEEGRAVQNSEGCKELQALKNRAYVAGRERQVLPKMPAAALTCRCRVYPPFVLVYSADQRRTIPQVFLVWSLLERLDDLGRDGRSGFDFGM